MNNNYLFCICILTVASKSQLAGLLNKYNQPSTVQTLHEENNTSYLEGETQEIHTNFGIVVWQPVYVDLLLSFSVFHTGYFYI